MRRRPCMGQSGEGANGICISAFVPITFQQEIGQDAQRMSCKI